jgi:hypothetical protein
MNISRGSSRSTVYIIPSFILLGGLLEGAAFWIGIAFTGVGNFGSHWGYTAIHFLAFWPNWFLPTLLPPWANLYLVAPILGWALLGLALTLWQERRPKSNGRSN